MVKKKDNIGHQNKIIIPPSVSMTVMEKHGRPCIEVRTLFSDPEIIRGLITAAYNERPVMIQPKFSDKMRSLSTLIDKGIIYRDNGDGNFYFLL
jgi:hypothetical protein